MLVLAAEVARIESNAPPAAAVGRQKMQDVLFHPDASMRRALILALGTYTAEGLSTVERVRLISKLLDLYRNDPDAGIHGAAEWTLRQWGQQMKITDVDAALRQLKDRGNRRWFVNGQGQAFAVVEGPVEFRMGSPPGEPDPDPDETMHRQTIPYRFAIGANEVTVEQYRRFGQEFPGLDFNRGALHKYSPALDGPRIFVNWFARRLTAIG